MKVLKNKSNVFILLISLVLFGISYFVGIATVIIGSMSFLILMETIRTIYEYVVNDEHRIKIRYVVDGGILFGFRELFVGWVMIKTSIILGLIIMIASIITIGILFFYRTKAIESSPDSKEKCYCQSYTSDGICKLS